MMHTIPLLLVLISTAYANSPMRQPSCAGTSRPISPQDASLYTPFFLDFDDSNRDAKDTLVFEAFAGLSTASSYGADTSEFLVTVRRIEQLVNPSTVSIPEIAAHWQALWLERSVAAEARGNASMAVGVTRRGAIALHTASQYAQLALRFVNHTAADSLRQYQRSIVLFERAMAVTGECTPAAVPYVDSSAASSLHAYWCAAAGASATSPPLGTIIAYTGYDGTAEMTFHSVGLAALQSGYNVLLVEGPGQGATARFGNLRFRPDWEIVNDQVVKFVTTRYNVATSSVIIWGRSFGGYLAPRAFAKSQYPLRALVADGGVYDFFQNGFCNLPGNLQEALGQDPSLFSRDISFYANNASLSLYSFLNFGYLGFGVDTPADLFLAWQPYWLNDSMAELASRPVLVMNPQLDSLTNNQSEIFFANLPSTRHLHTRLLTLDVDDGTSLHCGVGSSEVAVSAILQWLAGAK